MPLQYLFCCKMKYSNQIYTLYVNTFYKNIKNTGGNVRKIYCIESFFQFFWNVIYNRYMMFYLTAFEMYQIPLVFSCMYLSSYLFAGISLCCGCCLCQVERSEHWWTSRWPIMQRCQCHNSNGVIAPTVQAATQHLLLLVLFSFLLSQSSSPLIPPLSLYFSLTDRCCHGNKIWDKMGYNSSCTRDIFWDLCIVVLVVVFKLLHLVEICTLTSTF